MTTNITVKNLKCGGCANTIKTKISQIENISNIVVDIENSNVYFEARTNDDIMAVKDKLKSLGYPSIDEPNSVLSRTKSFISCATGKVNSNNE